MTILYSCDSNYVDQTMVSICSVIRWNREEKEIEFLVVGDSLLKEEKNRIQQLVEGKQHVVRFFELCAIPELEECSTDGFHPRSVYAKLFVDRLTEKKRILYLDSDVIASAGFSELFSIDLQGAVIAGVRMPYSKRVLKRQGLQGETYICDGIVLIDVEQWKRRRLSQKAAAYIRACRGRPKRLSEGVIHAVCKGEILVLHPRYNVMPQFLVFRYRELERMHRITGYYSEQEMEEAKRNPVFIHFMRELYNRPWLRKSGNQRWNHPYRGVYRQYQRKLGVSTEGREELSVRTKALRYLYEWVPFPVFLAVFLLFHRD